MEKIPYRTVMLLVTDVAAIKTDERKKVKKKTINSKEDLQKEIKSKQHLWD